MTLLEVVKTQYPNTKQFIKDLIDEECQKGKISADEVIFLQVWKPRVSSEKHFLLYSEYVRRYCIKLNSLGYNIYLHVM